MPGLARTHRGLSFRQKPDQGLVAEEGKQDGLVDWVGCLLQKGCWELALGKEPVSQTPVDHENLVG